MNDPFDYEGARQYALGRSERELSPDITYHSIYHTRDDVVVAVERLAQLEQIMADADPDSFGRNDFWERSLALQAELAAIGLPSSNEEWLDRQIRFVESHVYFICSAHQLRDAR